MASLTRDEAAARSDMLRVDRYQIDLDLSAARESEQFTSTTTVLFSCTQPGATTFVELKPVSIEAATLNGKPLDAGALDANRLPLAGLLAENELTITATLPYSKTGE